MNARLVIARDANSRPLKRLIISTTRQLAYLANPELDKAVESGEASPFGSLPSMSIYFMDLYFPKCRVT